MGHVPGRIVRKAERQVDQFGRPKNDAERSRMVGAQVKKIARRERRREQEGA
jgi:hypothetical protein